MLNVEVQTFVNKNLRFIKLKQKCAERRKTEVKPVDPKQGQVTSTGRYLLVELAREEEGNLDAR